jgi:hypothetical protein
MKYRMASHELYGLAALGFLVDHLGLYLYDDNLWLRVTRMFALVWFVPIGYNAGRKADLWMWQAAIGLAVVSTITGIGPLPLQAISTIVLLRLVIDPLAEVATRDKFRFWVVNAALVALIPVTDAVVEYGTMAGLFALAGWLLKNPDRAAPIVDIRLYFGLVTALYLLFCATIFPFTALQWVFVIVTTCWTSYMMFHFRDMLLESIRRKNPDIVARACRFIGHNTLQIYTLQLLILQAIYFF